MDIVLILVYLALVILSIASLWILFEKAGEAGWKSLIPIYNYYIILKIAGKPGWWLLLLIIPIVNFVISIMAISGFVKAYGKLGVGSVLLALFFPYFYLPYLAFSKDVQYVGQ